VAVSGPMDSAAGASKVLTVENRSLKACGLAAL